MEQPNPLESFPTLKEWCNLTPEEKMHHYHGVLVHLCKSIQVSDVCNSCIVAANDICILKGFKHLGQYDLESGETWYKLNRIKTQVLQKKLFEII